MAYQGKKELDVMYYARKYNHAIYKWIMNGQNTNSQAMLDFGAGKGEFCNRITDNIFAVEIDTSMHKFIRCPVENSIYNFNRKFDLIYSSNVLEHINNDMEAIQSLYNNLSESGVVKILVPARMEIYSNMDKNVGHYRRYNRENLIEKFTSIGFDIEYCKYFDFLGYFAAFVYKLTNGSGNISITSLKFYDAYIFPISKFIDTLTSGRIIGKNIILKAVKNG